MSEEIRIPDVSTSKSYIGRLHDWTIKRIIGKRPVMMNMNLEVEYSLGFNNITVMIHNCYIESTKTNGSDLLKPSTAN